MSTTAPVRAPEDPAIRFDEEAHRYYVDGRWVRSVTQVLNIVTGPIYGRIPEHILEYARARGAAVHGWTELYDLDELEGRTPDPEGAVWPYFQAWLRFREESGFQPLIVEQRLYHPRHRYCGTVDRIGLLNGRLVTLEIKTVAKLAGWVGLQTAGYQEAFNHGRPKAEQARDRFAVQLRRDGTYRLEQYSDAADLTAFLAMKHVWDWADANGAAPALELPEEEAA